MPRISFSLPVSFLRVPNSERPSVFLAAALLAAAPAAAQNLTLQEAMRLASTRSEEVLAAEERDARFGALKLEAISTGLPQVNLYANAGRASMPVDPAQFGQRNAPVFSVEQDRLSYGVEVNQALFTFGRLSQALKAARFQDRANRATTERTRQQIQLLALDAYHGVITAEARLKTLEASLRRQRETVAFLEHNFRLGAGTRADVLRSIAALNALEPMRIRAQRDLETARMGLNRLLGREVGAPVDLDTAGAFAATAPALPGRENPAAKFAAERPDVRALSLQRRSLENAARLLRMQYLPVLGAQGKFGILGYEAAQLDEWDNREWQVGIGLNWNLFDGLGNYSRARQMQSDARAAGHQEQLARKTAEIEITGALRERQAADTALAAARQALAAADEARALLSDEFRAGKGRLTDLLASEEALREAEFGLLNARYQRARSAAALKVALGRDLLEEEGM